MSYVCMSVYVYVLGLVNSPERGRDYFSRFSRFFHPLPSLSVFLSQRVLSQALCVCVFLWFPFRARLSSLSLPFSFSFSSPFHRLSVVVVFVLFFFFFRFFLLVFFRMVSLLLDDRRQRPLSRGTRSHGRSEVVITSSNFPTC